MRALVFDQTLELKTDYAKPRKRKDEILIQVLKAGICNTDLELMKGYKGFSGVLGHEFVGIAQGGKFDGKRVAGEINTSCGSCHVCRAGHNTHCLNRTVLGIINRDGAFADWTRLPEENLYPLPDSISDDAAVFIEPLAAGLQTLATTKISPHDRVVLLGAGKLGLLTAQVVALTGCDLMVVARHDSQRALLKKWGIPSSTSEKIKAKSADIVIDCTGNQSGFADALTMVKPRGTIHLKSTYSKIPKADLSELVVDEVTLATSRCGPFDAAIRVLSRGLVDVESLISERYSLDEGLKAMKRAARKGTLKVILDVV